MHALRLCHTLLIFWGEHKGKQFVMLTGAGRG